MCAIFTSESDSLQKTEQELCVAEEACSCQADCTTGEPEALVPETDSNADCQPGQQRRLSSPCQGPQTIPGGLGHSGQSPWEINSFWYQKGIWNPSR